MEWARSSWRRHGFGAAEDSFIALSSLLRLQRMVARAVESELRPFRLKLTDFLLLITLALTESGALPITQLARSLMIHAATATVTVDRLEARGLVHRAPHPTDRRSITVVLTSTGREHAEAAATALGGIDYGLDGTAIDDRRALVDVLGRLRAALEE